MDKKTLAGNLGELKVAAYFAELGYEVYIPWGGKSSSDLVVCIDGESFKIQVKTSSVCNTKSWLVQLKSVRSNKTGNKILKFDGNICDILAIYIIPEDKVHIIWDPLSLDGRSQINIPKI